MHLSTLSLSLYIYIYMFIAPRGVTTSCLRAPNAADSCPGCLCELTSDGRDFDCPKENRPRCLFGSTNVQSPIDRPAHLAAAQPDPTPRSQI